MQLKSGGKLIYIDKSVIKFEDEMTFVIEGVDYDENDNKIEILSPENNTAKITYDNKNDMESFILLIKIAIEKYWVAYLKDKENLSLINKEDIF